MYRIQIIPKKTAAMRKLNPVNIHSKDFSGLLRLLHLLQNISAGAGSSASPTKLMQIAM